MTDSRFGQFPSGAYHHHCENATTIFRNAHFTASSFLKTFEDSRKGARGTTTDTQMLC